jgi:hypothetical protein
MTPSRTLPAPGVRAWGLGAAGISGADSSLVPPLVIVGLGNEIASDDGVGLHAATALAAELRDRNDVEVVALPIPLIFSGRIWMRPRRRRSNPVC